MRLKNNEYDIVDEAINDGGVGIFVTKAALEKWRDHYLRLMKKYVGMGRYGQALAYLGKADVLIDLLKHFEEEGV